MNRSLLEKELRSLWRESILAGVVGAVGLAFAGEFILPYGPPTIEAGKGRALFALGAMLTGMALGVWQVESERRAGTEAFLHLRSSGRSAALAAKACAGWLALALTGAVSLGLHLAWMYVASPWRDVLQVQRLAQHAALGSLAFSGHALALWTTHLPRRREGRILALVLSACSLFWLSAAVSRRGADPASTRMAEFVVLQAVAAACAFFALHAISKRALEPERPLAAKLALRQIPMALLAFGLPTAVGVLPLQERLGHWAARTRTSWVRDESGDLHPVVWRDGVTSWVDEATGEAGERVRIGARARFETGTGRQAEALPGERDDFEWAFDQELTPLRWSNGELPKLVRAGGGRAFDLGAQTFLSVGERAQPLAWFDASTRRLRAVRWSGRHAIGTVDLGKGPQATPFSETSWPIWGDASSLAWFDGADGTLWAFNGGDEQPTLTAAPLPGLEEPTGVERVHSRWRARLGVLEPYGVSDFLVVRSASGPWQWGPQGWTRFEASERQVLEGALGDVTEWRLRQANDDALRPVVEIVDAGTGDVRSRLAAPRTLRGEGAIWASCALALLRPPPLALVASLQPVRSLHEPAGAMRSLYLDRALSGGARAWLVFLSLGLSLWLARASRGYLGRRGDSKVIRWSWTALIVLLGVPALVALGVFEPDRRRAHTESDPPKRASRAAQGVALT